MSIIDLVVLIPFYLEILLEQEYVKIAFRQD